jgi:hypothetical protein
MIKYELNQSVFGHRQQQNIFKKLGLFDSLISL